MLRTFRFCSALLLTFCLTACGFKLQGTLAPLPPQLQQVYVNSAAAPHSAIAPDLTVALENDKVTCVDDPKQALITLNILQDKQSSRQIGSGASQETRKYELTYSVVFTLSDSTGKRIYGPAAVSSTLIHYVYSGQVLGNNQEEGALYQSLRRNVIQKILFKLASDDSKAALVKNNS
ncbi:MAG: hypothetical protein KBD83_04670 [Gammaproteobacteria bacterium]|nr:hypothetical protein [Gammaproteobacteria bacterium]